MAKVKICGLTSTETALAASRAGADFVGFVFTSSRRHVTVEKALGVAQALHRLSTRPLLVGVFANAPAKEVNLIASSLGLDWVQLSGDEDWQYCREIEYPIIKVLHIFDDTRIDQVLGEIEKGYHLYGGEELIHLLDTGRRGTYGGTGETFSWQLAKEAANRFPVMVAGGLNPTNVGDLIKEVMPWGVDVSGGVETGGRKDQAKIEAFVKAVKNVT